MFVLNRFMTKYHPEFFSLSKEKQDEFKINNIDELESKFKKFIYKQILNVELKNENDAEKYEHLITPEILLELNTQSTYLRGIGNNYFYLNEWFGDNENMLTFKTLYDYDFDNHNFQEEALINEKHFPEKTEKSPYKMRMNFYWARAIINNKFHYLHLASSAMYLHSKIEEELEEFIKELIPHEYEEGKDFGKKESSGFVLDFKLNANGKEKELQDLKDYYNYKLNNKIYDELQDYFFNNPMNSIWIKEQNNESKTDPTLTYIFSDINVIKDVRFSHWEQDTNKYKTEDLSTLNNLFDSFFNKYKQEIKSVYNSIIEGSYVSDIKKKKPLKVVANEGFIDDLNKILDDED